MKNKRGWKSTTEQGSKLSAPIINQNQVKYKQKLSEKF